MDIYEIQDSINLKLADLFNKNGIKNFRLTSLGNSIATGYYIVRTTKPLLARNESINEIMSSNGIAVETNSVARPQDNNDEHIFEWLITNKKESEINSANIRDFKQGSKIKMPTADIDDKLEWEHNDSLVNIEVLPTCLDKPVLQFSLTAIPTI